MRLKADARILVTSEEPVASEIFLMSVSAWLMLELGGASAALAVVLKSPWSSSIQVRLKQVLAVYVCAILHRSNEEHRQDTKFSVGLL